MIDQYYTEVCTYRFAVYRFIQLNRVKCEIHLGIKE